MRAVEQAGRIPHVPGRLVYAFDTNMCAVPGIRCLWGTVCEAVGTAVVLTPTAASEVLRRERLETQRTWQTRLRAIEGELQAEWGPDVRRRLANVAATTSRDWLHDQLRTPRSPYRLDPQKHLTARQEEIDERLPDEFFDFSTDNGIQDKKIVVEAFAGGYHLLVSNNIGSIDLIGLSRWLNTGEGAAMNIGTRIETPRNAIECLETTHQMGAAWLAEVAARASVTDPYDEARSAREIATFIDAGLAERGVADVQIHLRGQFKNPRTLRTSLEAVVSKGRSNAARVENLGSDRVRRSLPKETGLSQSVFMD